MNTRTSTSLTRVILVVLAMGLVLSWGARIASAEEESGSSLSIAPTGQIIVKGARVVSVYGTTIIAETGWGAAKLSFAVQTSGSTRFVPELGSAQALAAIRPGHTLSFSGALSGSLTRPTVLATVVKDTELVQEAFSMVGTVQSVEIDGATFVLTGANGETTVRVPSSVLMSRNGNYSDVSDIEIGDSAKVTGTLDTNSGALTASRVSLVTGKDKTPDTVEAPSAGVFSSLIGWLRGSRGILSVRDR